MRVSQIVHDIVGYQVSDLISQKIMTVNEASDWLIHNLGTVMPEITMIAWRRRSTKIPRRSTTI